MIKRIVLSAQARADLAALDRAVGLRIVGDWRLRFHAHGEWIDVLRVRNRKDAYR